jgi:hypothetical protein
MRGTTPTCLTLGYLGSFLKIKVIDYKGGSPHYSSHINMWRKELSSDIFLS